MLAAVPLPLPLVVIGDALQVVVVSWPGILVVVGAVAWAVGGLAGTAVGVGFAAGAGAAAAVAAAAAAGGGGRGLPVVPAQDLDGLPGEEEHAFLDAHVAQGDLDARRRRHSQVGHVPVFEAHRHLHAVRERQEQAPAVALALLVPGVGRGANVLGGVDLQDERPRQVLVPQRGHVGRQAARARLPQVRVQKVLKHAGQALLVVPWPRLLLLKVLQALVQPVLPQPHPQALQGRRVHHGAAGERAHSTR